MRRVLTILAAVALSMASLAVGLFTADLPFWQRAVQLPLEQDDIYLPVAVLGVGPGAGSNADPPLTVSAAPASEPLEQAARRARDAGSRALLVRRGDQLLMSRYFGEDDERTLLPAGIIARPVTAMAVGLALRDGAVALDAPVAPQLDEWDGERRGRITLRQLLEETSGLEDGGDIDRLLHRSPWQDLHRLPRFATSKGVRMLLGNDFENSALRFELKHEPGGFYHPSPANPQLAAVILERATQRPFERFVDERLWRPVGAGRAELGMDRRAGMPAAHCCWRATAPDMARVLALLARDGLHRGQRVLPEGGVQEMARAARVNADSGLLVARANAGGWFALRGEVDGSAFWVVPQLGITIVNIVGDEGETPPELAALLLRVYGQSK
jgi:CubicO group peptidase (beta-lactamase class C family)